MKSRKITKYNEIILPSEIRLSEFRERLLSWFRENGRNFPWRKKSATNYERIIAEILLQRTQSATVAKFLPSFIKHYSSWKRLSQASERDLQEILKPIGLWKRRASSLYLLSQEMEKRNGRFPKKREEIEYLPGMGQYIANAVLMFCHGGPHPLLDGNMARVLERYFGPRQLADIRYDPFLQALSEKVVAGEISEAYKINWAILDLASLVCERKVPRCGICPISKGCQFRTSSESLTVVLPK